MVASGVVAVSAEIDGDTLSASAVVTVAERGWMDRIGPPSIKYFSCPDPLTPECPLPAVPVHWHDLGRTDPGPTSWPSVTAYVEAGPNAGYGYFPGAQSFVNIRDPWIAINGVLRNPDHAFWRDRSDCNVQEVHDNVVEHEMIHYEGIRDAVQAGITRGWLESFTPYGTHEEVQAAFREILTDYATALRNAADMSHTNPRFRNPDCELNLPPTRRNPPVPGRDRN
jgi:hypothetical protein